MNVNVNVSFEAKNKKEAIAAVKAWKLIEGARVHISLSEAVDPFEADASGKLREVDLTPPLPVDGAAE